MSRKIDTDPSYLTKSSPIVTAYPFTGIVWFLPSTISKLHRLWSMADTAGNVNQWGTNYLSSNTFEVFCTGGPTPGNHNATTSNTGNLDEWNMGAAVFASSTDRRAILNADFANEGTNTADSTPAGLDNTSIGAFVRATVFASGADFLIAHVAVWNVALTDDEVTALNTGAFPHEVRPSALLAHWPMWGNHEPEIVFGPKASDDFQMSLVSAPAKGDHRASKLWTANRQFISV